MNVCWLRHAEIPGFRWNIRIIIQRFPKSYIWIASYYKTWPNIKKFSHFIFHNNSPPKMRSYSSLFSESDNSQTSYAVNFFYDNQVAHNLFGSDIRHSKGHKKLKRSQLVSIFFFLTVENKSHFSYLIPWKIHQYHFVWFL